jgi:2-keto-4-pentenoate hydratase/2-oxohepta-3-ene-1,7-dioic acid hydratase in catechol pathway
MKLATYLLDNVSRVGAVIENDQTLVDLAGAERALAAREGRAPHPCFGDLVALLTAGAPALAAAARAIAAAGPECRRPVAGVRLQSPIPLPRKVLCLAGNYQDHIEEEGSRMAEQDTQTPRIFMKPPSNTVIGPGDPILIPAIGQAIDWEGELAVVIGRRCKAVPAEQALACVAGYTVVNDVSERKLKIKARTQSRPRDEWFDWLNGKWFDSFCPLGPWLVTADELPDPHTLDIRTYVNGELKQHNNTRKMLYRVPEIIAYITAMITLEPGDVICTGTIAGVGNSTGTYLQPGDQVRVEIERIGQLCNPVARG